MLKRIGSVHTVIGRYERDEMKPSVDVVKDLAETLQTTAGYLLGESQDMDLLKEPLCLKMPEKEFSLSQLFILKQIRLRFFIYINMSQINLDDLFHGKEVSKLKKNLEAELLMLEEKYSDIFEGLANKKPTQGKITNHYILMITDNLRSFTIRSDSQLPDYIKMEMNACFYKHFKK